LEEKSLYGIYYYYCCCQNHHHYHHHFISYTVALSVWPTRCPNVSYSTLRAQFY
jgi:hypothetical protein